MGSNLNSRRKGINMNANQEEAVSKELEKSRLPYHAPILELLGSVQSLVQGLPGMGSDASYSADCEFI